MASDDERRERLLQVVAQPLLVVFWALVLWGTLYGAVLLYAALEDGPGAALERTLSGRDAGAGFLNLALVVVAVVVWASVGVAVWRSRASAASRRRGDGPDR
jgi:hypothetical protein